MCIVFNNWETLLTGQVISTGPTFLDESQNDSAPYGSTDFDSTRKSTGHERSPLLKPSPLPKLARKSSPQVVIEASNSSGRKRPFAGTPEPTKRKVAKKNITPKLRHNDSQIHFAPINSSPIADADDDSQLLTDRQREVKERQTEVGALFADLRPNSQSKNKSRLSKLTLSPEINKAKSTSPEVPITPTITERDKVPSDNYITSSPTPRRGSPEEQLDSDAYEVPSSPPYALLQRVHAEPHVQTPSKASGSDGESDMWDVTSSVPLTVQDVSFSSRTAGPATEIVEHAMDLQSGDVPLTEDGEEDADGHQTDRPRTPLESNEGMTLDHQAARTPNEIFVDALSSPGPPTPRINMNSDDLYANAISSPVRAALQQVTALPDCERILSPVPNHHHDSQISYSMSEADEDSILRLINRFDSSASELGGASKTEEERFVQSPRSSQAHGVDKATNARKHNRTIKTRSNKRTTSSTRNSKSPIEFDKDAAEIHESETDTNIAKHSRPVEKKRKSRRISSRLTRNAAAPSTIPETQNLVVLIPTLDPRLAEANTVESETSAVESRRPSSVDLDLEVQCPTIEEAADVEMSLHESHHNDKDLSPARRTLDPEAEDCEEQIRNESPKKSDTPAQSIQRNADQALATVHSQEISIVTGSNEELLTGSKVISDFEQALEALRRVALTRGQAMKLENLLWDVKGELYAAEKRGRMAEED
jgi:hypothetical protein